MTLFKKLGAFKLPALLRSGQIAEFDVFLYIFGKEKFSVLVKGNATEKENVLTRVHSACSIGHVFHSMRCDCSEQLDNAMELIAKENGIIIYVWGHEGRGVGMEKHIMAYVKQDGGLDTVDAFLSLGFPVDTRNYSLCAEILKDLGIRNVRLLTNNPSKIDGLEKAGITVSERVPLIAKPTYHNMKQLIAKREKMGHIYPINR